jgi:hypothetical protein
MEPEGSLLHLQVPATCPYPEGVQYFLIKYPDQRFNLVNVYGKLIFLSLVY